MRVYILAGVGNLGGTLRKCWDLLRLFVRNGLRPTLLATQDLDAGWHASLANLGCQWKCVANQPLSSIEGLPGGIVIGICNLEFIAHAEELRRLGCRRVWVNSMTRLFPQETMQYAVSGTFEAYVFDSPFQRTSLESGLAQYGYQPQQGQLIEGVFEVADWPFDPRPAEPNGEFVMGKLARPDISKWPRNLWSLLDGVRHPRRRVLLMGADGEVRNWMGIPPQWAEILMPDEIPAREFYRRLHCLVPINFACFENWPRIGLEAMATGVPIIAPREGGWCDMITPGENGFLFSSPAELIDLASQLASDETFRLMIIRQARHQLETELANAERIWLKWEALLRTLAT